MSTGSPQRPQRSGAAASAARRRADAPLLALQRGEPVLFVLRLLGVALQRAGAIDVALWAAHAPRRAEAASEAEPRERKAFPSRVAPGCRESLEGERAHFPDDARPGCKRRPERKEEERRTSSCALG